MKNSRAHIFRMIFTLFFDIIAVFSAFWFAYYLRNITDGIPFVQLRIPYISVEQFSPFVWYGVAIWIIVFFRAKLYSHIGRPLLEEIRGVLVYGFFWFFVYIGFVYLTQGFLFSKEIPRLIIFHTLILWVVFSLIFRSIILYFWNFFAKKNIFTKLQILVIRSQKNEEILFETEKSDCEYIFADISEVNRIEHIIRKKPIYAIVLTSGEFSDVKLQGVIHLAKIYGIVCAHPRIMPHMKHFSKEETFLAGIPVVALSAVAITPWEMIIKRIIDIIWSVLFLIVTSPILLVAYIGIKIEDPTGPVIYRNRRIGQNGKIFTLYKFRYMYWKYCVKEEYIREGEKDEWLEFEEQLKKTNDSRNGPLYKIQNDPRRMKFWGFLEKFSLDELPQLFNVLLGNMSLVGPRPHQPREVALYDESDKQVLTIKPWITGMAQVYGRDKNTFKEEVLLDTYYIENYSVPLDFVILLRTIFVVLRRPFDGK